MSARTDNTLILIGSGPEIGRSIASLFAAKRYNHVALIARNLSGDHLEEDRKAVQAASSPDVLVKTYVCDVADTTALVKTLNAVEADLGQVECIYFNPARIFPQPLLEHDLEEINYDWKVCRLLSRILSFCEHADMSRSPALLSMPPLNGAYQS
jgi:NAD(P)-dependent dehydrogenase (short-subunit alcohol dehydrogenase family)